MKTRLSSQSDEFLGRGRMNRDAVVEVRLGGAHANRDPKALKYFVRTNALHVHADDLNAFEFTSAARPEVTLKDESYLLIGQDADELERKFGLSSCHGMVHRAELGLVDLEVVLAVSFFSFSCTKSYIQFFLRKQFQVFESPNIDKA